MGHYDSNRAFEAEMAMKQAAGAVLGGDIRSGYPRGELAPSASGVFSEVGNLSERLDVLGNLIAELEGPLMPILLPRPPDSTATIAGGNSITTQMAQVLREKTERVNQMIRFVAELRDRIAL